MSIFSKIGQYKIVSGKRCGYKCFFTALFIKVEDIDGESG